MFYFIRIERNKVFRHCVDTFLEYAPAVIITDVIDKINTLNNIIQILCVKNNFIQKKYLIVFNRLRLKD